MRIKNRRPSGALLTKVEGEATGYEGVYRGYELHIVSTLSCLWFLILPDKTFILGNGNPFMDLNDTKKLQGYENNTVAEWMKDTFKKCGIVKSEEEIISAIKAIPQQVR